MRTTLIFGALIAMLIAAGPASADHKLLLPPDEPQAERPQTERPQTDRPQTERPNPEATSTGNSLDIDLKLGLDGFRLGGRLFGHEGYAGGAWLNGATRPDGFSVDGGVERDGKAHKFKMNIGLDEWMRRAAAWWIWSQSKL
jgi:hypothetical protein